MPSCGDRDNAGPGFISRGEVQIGQSEPNGLSSTKVQSLLTNSKVPTSVLEQPNESAVAMAAVTKHCASCHGPNGMMASLPFVTFKEVRDISLRMALRLSADTMPPAGSEEQTSLGAEQRSTLIDWLRAETVAEPNEPAPAPSPLPTSGAVVTPLPTVIGTPNSGTPNESDLAMTIMRNYCVNCHGTFGDFDKVRARKQTLAQRIETGGMPLAGSAEQKSMNSENRALLVQWLKKAEVPLPGNSDPTPSPTVEPTVVANPEKIDTPAALALIKKHCAGCHSSSSESPFSTLEEISELKGKADGRIRKKRMPPPSASPAQLDMSDDVRMALVEWLKRSPDLD